MVGKKWECGTRRTLGSAIAVLVLTAIMLALPQSALALPSEFPDDTPMVDGRVRAIEQVGTNIWVGGRLTKVKKRDGTVLDNVTNLAVFDSKTEEYTAIAPDLGGTGAEVWDMMVYGGTGQHADDVLIAGTFVDPDDPTNTKHKNLVLVNGTTGEVIRWYNSPSLKSVLAAPNVSASGGDGRVYGGGVSLSAFDFATGKKLWTKAKTTVDATIRTHDSKPAYRDLELDADGQTIWAACICDKVDANAAKALVKLDTEGNHDASWLTHAGTGAFGQSVVDHNGKLYLGAGGSDFVAEYDKLGDGARGWVRDTSGSTQAVAVMDDKLVIGGHFYAVGDQGGDRCGAGRPGDLDKKGNPILNPYGECQRRQGIAAYSFNGDDLDPWDPAYSGSYSLVWELHVEGPRLHTGGEFKKVSGVVQNSYARLSPASL
jgi:hypothetical protein